MICDSASIHGRYTGSEPSPTQRDSFDIPLQKSSATLSPTPATSAQRRDKKLNAAIENKSTSWWDDASSSKNIVRTADFSVAAPPLPFDGDGTAASGAKPGSFPQQTVASSSRSRSRGWLVIGIAVGLAVSAVIWRRRRHDSAA